MSLFLLNLSTQQEINVQENEQFIIGRKNVSGVLIT